MICPCCGQTNLPGNDLCERCGFALASVDRPTGQDRIENSLLHDTVATLAPAVPVTLPLKANLGEAVAILTQQGIGAILILDTDQRLRGILTERDFLVEVAGLVEDYACLPVTDFMTPNPETVSPHDILAFALFKMDVGGYRHLPVVEDGSPVGIISVRDLLRHITQLCQGMLPRLEK